jgi:HK97 family phage major capsid protein
MVASLFSTRRHRFSFSLSVKTGQRHRTWARSSLTGTVTNRSEKMSKYLGSRLAKIHERMRALAGSEDPGDQKEFWELSAEFDKTNGRGKSAELAEGVRSGRFRTLSGDGGGPGLYGENVNPTYDGDRDGVDDDRRLDRGLRSAAMRQLDRNVNDGTMAARGAETIETLLSTGHPAERTWAARWAEAAGDPDYLSSFQKRLIDPEGARDRFSNKEIEAVRRVHQVAGERAMGDLDTAGGFLIPAQLDPAILLASSGSNNPIREMARVVQTVGESWKGVSTAGATSRWAVEASEANDDSPPLAQPEVVAYKGDCFVPYSVELEGDSAVGFVTEVSKVMIDTITQLQNVAYTLGSGIGQPVGYVTALSAGSAPSVVNSITADVLASGDVYALQSSLAPRFQQNSAWAANLSILNSLRQFETTAGALKFPSLQNDPPTLLGRRAFEISNMDPTVDAGQHNYVLAVGDWSQFIITDRVGTRIEVAPLLFGANRRPTGMRGFYAWFRTGSDVLVPNAFRLLDC